MGIFSGRAAEPQENGKRPLSRKWAKKLGDGDKIIEAARAGTVLALFADFPPDMAMPPEVLGKKGDEGFTFLHHMALKGHMDQALVLAQQHGFDLAPLWGERANNGNTILHNAALSGNLQQLTHVSQQLGLDLAPLAGAKNDGGFTFLHSTAVLGFCSQVPPMARQLGLDLGPLIGEKDRHGRTFMDLADSMGHGECASQAYEKLEEHSRQLRQQKARERIKKIRQQMQGKNSTGLHLLKREGGRKA